MKLQKNAQDPNKITQPAPHPPRKLKVTLKTFDAFVCRHLSCFYLTAWIVRIG